MLLYLGLPGALLLALWIVCIRMPGSSYQGPLEPLDARGLAAKGQISRDVEKLAVAIGTRHVGAPSSLAAAANHIEQRLVEAGYPSVSRFLYEVDGVTVSNLQVEVRGSSRPDEIVVIGAHYDTTPGTPGADDNASGTAAMLSLARTFVTRPQPRTLRFVAFVNEEPPYFQTADMGSTRYAKEARERGDAIVAMLSLETMGYYSDAPESQDYPFPLSLFYPDRANFIAVVGNIGSRALVHQAVASFRRHARFPCEGAAAPELLPGVTWSDHWSFWNYDYPAVMVTDTAPFRNPNYHEPTDTLESLDLDRLARVVIGLESVVVDLAGG